MDKLKLIEALVAADLVLAVHYFVRTAINVFYGKDMMLRIATSFIS